MKVIIDRIKIERMPQYEFIEYLRSKGLDTSKEITKLVSPTHNYSYIFIGESLADKIVGCIKTVVGLVPITEPWEAT